MKRTISIILPALVFIFFLQGSCEKEDESPTVCGVENPHENLEWLKTILNKRFCTEVYKITYKGEEYIGVYDCPDGADYGAIVYHCDGTKYCEIIGFTGESTCPDDFWENIEETLIYKKEK
jgi:hypothetical protein